VTAYDDDIEAILGGAAKPKPHGGLQPAPSRAQKRAALAIKQQADLKASTSRDGNLSSVSIKNGVTVNWLAAVFGKTTEWVRNKLVDCPPMSQHGKSFRYDIKVAAQYLVTPKMDIGTYLRDLKATDLPASLQKEIWDARLKRQKWEALAGDLWHTQDVMAVLSSTFAIIKSTVQLWPDTVERQEGLTDAQRDLLVRLGDTLQDEIYQGLVDAARERSTKPSLFDVDEDETSTEIVLGDDDDLEDVL